MEYALEAINNAAASVGVLATDGVVLAGGTRTRAALGATREPTAPRPACS